MSDMAMGMDPSSPDRRSMAERLASAYADATESLNLLRETLKAGGVLKEAEDSAQVRGMTPTRTDLEKAVTNIEDLGWMIRDLNNQVVI